MMGYWTVPSLSQPALHQSRPSVQAAGETRGQRFQHLLPFQNPSVNLCLPLDLLGFP